MTTAADILDRIRKRNSPIPGTPEYDAREDSFRRVREFAARGAFEARMAERDAEEECDPDDWCYPDTGLDDDWDCL